MTKPVFEVSDKLLVASPDMMLSMSENKGADQSARIRRLVCAFVVRKPRSKEPCTARLHVGRNMTKPVFGVSDKARLKPVYPATKTN